jgi:hypothetical protein
MTDILNILPQMGVVETRIEYPVNAIVFEDGIRTQRICDWLEPRYRFRWKVIETLPVTTWSDIWEFYKSHRGPEQEFYLVHGFAIPDIYIHTAIQGESSIWVNEKAGFTANALAREGNLIYLTNAAETYGELKQILSISSTSSPYMLSLDSNLAHTYTSSDKIKFAYKVVFAEDNLELDMLVSEALSTGIEFVTP